MKKYRLTKITVKTKEIISISKDAQDLYCPFCLHSLSASLPANESSAALPAIKKQTAELPPAKN